MGTILVRYRKNGQVVVAEAERMVTILDSYQPWPFGEVKELDLTGIPVIECRSNPARGSLWRFAVRLVKKKREEGKSFQGAFVRAEGTGEEIVFSDQGALDAVLKGEKIRGGRPETRFVNPRFLSDGRYVADEAMFMHGVQKNTVRAIEVEAIPYILACEMMVSDELASFPHRLRTEVGATVRALMEIARVDALRNCQDPVDVCGAVYLYLVNHLDGVTKVADIPDDLHVSPDLVMPDLAARSEQIMNLHIPGIGERRLVERQCFVAVRLSVAEIASVEGGVWPDPKVEIYVTDLPGFEFAQKVGNTEKAWEDFLQKLDRLWVESFRESQPIKDTHVVLDEDGNFPTLPSEVLVGRSPMKKAEMWEYPAFVKAGNSWRIRWFHSKKEATSAKTLWAACAQSAKNAHMRKVGPVAAVSRFCGLSFNGQEHLVVAADGRYVEPQTEILCGEAVVYQEWSLCSDMLAVRITCESGGTQVRVVSRPRTCTTPQAATLQAASRRRGNFIVPASILPKGEAATPNIVAQLAAHFMSA